MKRYGFNTIVFVDASNKKIAQKRFDKIMKEYNWLYIVDDNISVERLYK